jgi:hypothetical protein
MKMIKQLGVKMNQKEMFEYYKAIYEENLKGQKIAEDKRCNRKRI